MFRRPTVFIVGAGASKELGLPTGAELSQKIIRLAAFARGGGGYSDESARFLSILNDSAESREQLVAWRKAVADIRAALDFKDSIDAVIDQYHDRPEVAAVGKFMIAQLILEAELKSSLGGRSDGEAPLRAADESWLKTFARMLFEGVRKDELAELGKNLTIICFNYDRCIEWYLTHAVAQTYSLDLEAAAAVASQVTIHHAYGQLGRLPLWPHQAGTPTAVVPFGSKPDGVDVWRISEGLQTFSESRDSHTDELIKAAIHRGRQYVYLGLSFGRQNMDLLSVPKSGAWEISATERPVYASGAGQSKQAVKAICRLLQRTYAPGLLPMSSSVSEVTLATHVEVGVTARELLDLHWHNIVG